MSRELRLVSGEFDAKSRRRKASARWHYNCYADGSEALYDYEHDPHEWYNLASEDEHSQVLAQMRRTLPKLNAEPVIGEWQRWEIEAWRKAEELGQKSTDRGKQ